MQHDSHTVRIQVAEVHDGDAIDTIEQVTGGRGIPARHMDQQPAWRCGKVTPCPQVLDEKYGTNGAFENQTVEQGPLRYRDLAQYRCNSTEIDRSTCRSSR